MSLYLHIEKNGTKRFVMLHDAELRRRFGLREARVPDARRTLPGCTSAHGLIQARNLTHAHKGRKPLYEGVNFDLPGGVTAIIGHNGAGKTTLARILAGLDQQQNGEIFIRDQPCDAKQRMRHSGLVLQNADHQLHMYVMAILRPAYISPPSLSSRPAVASC